MVIKKQTQRIPNQFDVSNGNIETLQTIIKMMTIPKWRDELRKLVLDYKMNIEWFR